MNGAEGGVETGPGGRCYLRAGAAAEQGKTLGLLGVCLDLASASLGQEISPSIPLSQPSPRFPIVTPSIKVKYQMWCNSNINGAPMTSAAALWPESLNFWHKNSNTARAFVLSNTITLQSLRRFCHNSLNSGIKGCRNVKAYPVSQPGLTPFSKLACVRIKIFTKAKYSMNNYKSHQTV